ncbi:hypothetical protein GCM10029976_093010 [Kribbella albertanoniae]|uniref:XRE family transcriptional regulator n=1 Tax=Kribbella albertanoniae TaxID=1266829 RepID=A0A4V2XSE4_9ACTN|nr:helix-turn-helix transcriptional regulator [Kribbella albertanoniae]TDC33155.1 XRE family transcriptional regulator [Kribbella albertanoniae]
MTGSSEAWLRRSPDGSAGDDVGSVVREYRLARRLSQVSLSETMGFTQQFLSQVESGTRKVSLEHRRRFAEELGIPAASLGLSDGTAARGTGDELARAVAISRGQWRAQRKWLNQHRSELAKCAARLYSAEHRLPRTPLIAGDGWLPDELIDVESIKLQLDETVRAGCVTGREPQTLHVRPLRTPDTAFDTYTSAVRHLDPPTLFESRPSYRLLGGSLAQRMLKFGLGAYFDKLDVSEALGHEMAIACAGGIPEDVSMLGGQLPFRELIGDPFDLARRSVIPAITTLTIRLRRYPAEPSYLLHWRDPAKVATAAGVYDVIPAGEFQPSTVALWDRRNDFSIWRNIVREYAEELLGEPEHDGSRSDPIDYANWPLYQVLSDAKASGALTAFVVGMGLDALTLAATILTVVVIDDDTFTRAFGRAVRFNDEGEIVGIGDGRGADGIPFTQQSVDRMLESEPMASPGAAVLALAWEHRHELIA